MAKFTSSLKYAQSTAYEPLGFSGHPWQPGLRRAPYAGLASLVTAFISILVSVFILLLSNGDEVTSWKFQPTVYLAIASTVTNVMLAFALFQGIAIAWWQKALQEGTTIADLHRIWDYGNNFQSAILAGRHVNLVAIASVLVAISPINGPLLQRASTFGQVRLDSSRTLDVRISTLIPRGYTAIISSRGDFINSLRSNFSVVAGDYYSGAQIPISSDCRGKCSTKIVGAGFHASCTEYEAPYNVSSNYGGQSDNPTVFGTSVVFDYSKSAIVNLTAQYKPTGGCLGRLRVQNCTLQAGTVEYPVVIDGPGKSISLAPDTDIWDDVKVGDPDSIQPETHLNGFTTYGGIALAMRNDWNTALGLNWNGVIGYSIVGAQSKVTVAHTRNLTERIDCNIYFTDPMPDFLQSARDLMFRTALASANITTPIQRVTSQEVMTPLTYHTSALFLSLATLASVFPLFAVLATYRRFWTLGRVCSLSPIETAKAFNAAALRGSDSNAPISVLLKTVGNRPIKYGVMEGRKATADNDPVYDSQGWTGPNIEMRRFEMNNNANNSGDQVRQRRMQLADPTQIAPVREDDTFRD